MEFREETNVRKSAQKHTEIAKYLSFGELECYSRIIHPDIIDRLNSQDKCIANNKTKRRGSYLRCGNKVKDSEAAQAIIRKLASITRPCEFSGAAKILLEIIDATVCTRSHQSDARMGMYNLCCHFYRYHPAGSVQEAKQIQELRQLEHWIIQIVKPIKDLERVPELNSPPTSDDTASSMFENSSSGAAKQNLDPELNSPKMFVFEQRHSFSENLGFPAEKFRLAESLTHPNLRLYSGGSKTVKNLSPKDLVEKIARSPLGSKNRKKPGMIYVFWNEGDFAYVKIGYTTMSIQKRLDAWRKQCGHRLSEHTEKSESERMVQHPHRVEKLIHAELKKERYEEPQCSGCGKRHIEWFQIDAGKAQEVVEKWTVWMQDMDPYDENGNFRTGIELPSVEKQSGVEEQAGSASSKVEQRRRSTRHHNLRSSTKRSGRKSDFS